MRWTGWLLTALGAVAIGWGIGTYYQARGGAGPDMAAIMFAQALLVSGTLLFAAGLAFLSFGGCCGWCGDEACGCSCGDCQGEQCCGKCACCAPDAGGAPRPMH